MKRILLLLTILLSTLGASALEFDQGNFHYATITGSKDSQTGLIHVRLTGFASGASGFSDGHYRIDGYVTHEGTTYLLEEISTGAFMSLPNMQYIHIGYGVRRIAKMAFFDLNNTIRSIYLPSSLKTVEEQAFIGAASNCAITFNHLNLPTFANGWIVGLQSGQFNVYVPTQAQVDDINNDAFFKTYKPKSITKLPSVACDISQVLDGFRYYSVFVQEPTALQEGKLAVVYASNESSTFNGFLISAASSNYATVGSGVKRSYYTEIADSAFMGSFSTYSGKVQISGSHMERIGRGAFANCTSLESAVISGGTTIDTRAFYNCTSLKSLDMYYGEVKTIGNYAFANTGIESVSIPGTVTNLAPSAFAGSSLKSYSVASSNTTYSAYNGMLFNKDQTELISVPTMTPNTSINGACLPLTLTTIGTQAFERNKTVTEVSLPYGVTTIRANAFCYAENIKYFRLPSSVKTIGGAAFYTIKNFDLCLAWIDNLPTSGINNNFLASSTPSNIYIPNANVEDKYKAVSALSSRTLTADPMKAFDFMDVATPSDGGMVVVTSCVTKDATAYDGGDATIVGGSGKVRIGTGGGVKVYYPDDSGYWYNYTSIYPGAFRDNEEITEVSISSSYLTSIGTSAFREAPNVTSISIDAPATIGAHAFYKTNAETITLKRVTQLSGQYVFCLSTKCKTLNIPASMNYIHSKALVETLSMETFTVDAANPYFSQDLHGFIYTKDKTCLVAIPGGTPFTVLKDVAFPNAMTEIGDDVFQGNNIKEVWIPYGVTKIGNAFSTAVNLETLIIPSSVRGGFSLTHCRSLKYLTINNEVPPTLSSSDLTRVPSSCYVYVPLRPISGIIDHDEANVGDYKDNSNWSRFKVRYGAYDFIDNSLAYTVQSDGTLALVQGQYKGDILRQYDNNNNQLKSITVPETVTYRGNTYTVTVLDNAAFKDNTAVESITLPNTITNFKGVRDWNNYVGCMYSGMQFSGCTSLKSIKLPSNITAIPAKCFQNTKIEKLTLPYGIKTIATRAFGYAEIGELLIPSSCQQFWYSQFIDMESLDRLILNVSYDKYDTTILDQPYFNDVKSMLSDTRVYVPYGSYNDYSSLDLFSKAKSVETGAYDFKVNGGAGGYLTVMGTQDAKFVEGTDYNEAITSVTMGLVEDDIYTDKHFNATSLEERAFFNARNLSQFDLNGVELTEIPDSAFEYCTKLSTMPFNSPYFRPKTIGAAAFSGSGLRGSVILPETVTNIGNKAFSSCPKLDELVLPYMLDVNIKDKTFYSTQGMKAGFRCYAHRRNIYTMKLKHTNVYPYVRENTQWTTVTLRNVGSDYFQVEDIMGQGGELYVVDAVSDKWVASMKKVQPGQRVDKSGQYGYLARIEPGKLYRLSVTNRNDITFPQTTNLLLPKYTITSDGRPVPEILDENLYKIDPDATPASSSDETNPAPRFVKCSSNEASLIGYGYLSTKYGGPDVITTQQSVRGDVNGDGKVGIGDIVAITNVMAGIETNPDIIARANVNGDQSIGIGDIVAITNIMAGIDNVAEEPKAYLICPDDQHPHWIDMGLPSGTQWRCCNEGATTPEEFGGYYQFGQVSTAPTLDQINELLNTCCYIWTTQNGVKGGKFFGPNGNTIFLPAAGYSSDGYNAGWAGCYWSSTLHSGASPNSLNFNSDLASWGNSNDSHSVRPVRKN